jgi:general secretion pathway protein G
VQGSSTRTANYLLHETPVFVRAGSVIARQGPETLRAGNPSPHLIIDAYPGGNGKWEIYEDDGESLSYRSGEALWIPLVHRQEKESRQVLVGPALGDYKGASRSRHFTIRLHGSPPPHTVTLDGSKIPWRFDGMNGTLEFRADDINLERETCFEAHFDFLEPTVFCHGWKGFMARMESLQQAVNSISPVRPIHPEERLTTRIAQTGNRLTRFPETCREELLAVERDIERLPQVLQEYDEACTRAKKQKAVATLQRAARLLSAVQKPTLPLNNQKKRAFTLVEILAVIAIVGILAAVLLPAYGRMQQNAGATRCASNLRQISTYINQFAADNNGCLPIAKVTGGKLWYQELTPYFKFLDVPTVNQSDIKTFVCPQSNFPQRSDRNAMGLSYGMNLNFDVDKQHRTLTMTRPLSKIILLTERWASKLPDPEGRRGGADANWSVDPPYRNAPNTSGVSSLRVKHGNSSNYLFLDGHIERLEPAQTYPDGKDSETNLWIVK